MGTGRGGTGPKSRSKKKGYKKAVLSVKRRTKDIDQIQDEMAAIAAGTMQATRFVDADAPGAGEHYCLTCARHFIAQRDLATHNATKAHKKRLKVVARPQYNQAEADAGAGLQPAVKGK